MGMLAASPALAADPYIQIEFVSNAASSSNDTSGNPGGVPGIKGVATYTFSETDIGEMTLNLWNTSTNTGDAFLVGSGFDLPSPSSSPASTTTIKINSFSALDKWGVTVNGTLKPENKFGQYDICATTNEQNGKLGTCDAGAAKAGVAKGKNADVATFVLSSSPSLASAIDYRNAFASLFTATPDNSFYMRFKGIEGLKFDSDKILATRITTGGGTTTPPQGPPNPPQGPPDAVPGPLPLFGTAAAFGFSRRLRRRLKANTLIG